MEPSAFDQFMRLGDELQSDYGHMFDGGDDQMIAFDGTMDGDLSLLLSDLDAPSSTSSYSGQASQSSSSSPAASLASSNCFPYQDMLADSSPYALESPPPMHHDSNQMYDHESVLPIGGGEMGNGGGGYYEDYASPAGTYSSSEDSGHHSPAASLEPLYDLEAGCVYDYGCVQQPQLQRRSSSEDSEFAAPAAPAARRVLRLQQQAAADPAPMLQQQQPARVVYVLPPQQQLQQPLQVQQRPPAARSTAYKVAPPARVVQQQARPQPQQLQQVVRSTTRPAAATPTFQTPLVMQQQTPQLPKTTTVLLARTAPCVQLVSTPNGARLVAPIKVEPKQEEITEEEDLQYFRKQEDRKQKNRAAAQQSRLRRRCELDELRTTVSELSERNRELVEENGRLKRRVHELESHAHWSPPRKRVAAAGAATFMLVFVMMFAFQATPLDRSLSPFSLPVPVSRQISEAAAAASSAHSRVVRDVGKEVAPATRALLAIEDYDEEAAKKESVEMAEYAAKLAQSRNETGKEREGCGDKGMKRYPNQTETIRLNTELNNWVESHDLVEWASGLQGGRRMFTLSGQRRLVVVADEKEEKRNGTVSPFDAPSVARVRVSTNETAKEGRGEVKKMPKKKSPRGEAKREAAKERAMRDRAWKHIDMVSPGLREHGPENRPDWSSAGGEQPERMNRRLVGAAGEKERDYERLAAAVQQRTDTLYVVAMKDYLLLPAIEGRNATSRPRISLILPAVMNGTMTTANNQIMLMRLDLDVVGTGTIHLAEGLRFP